MYIVGQGFDATGETLGIGLELPIGSSLQRAPAIIQTDEIVTGVEVALGDHEIGHLHEQFFPDTIIRIVLAVDVAAESLPGQPSHGRSACQSVLQRRN